VVIHPPIRFTDFFNGGGMESQSTPASSKHAVHLFSPGCCLFRNPLDARLHPTLTYVFEQPFPDKQVLRDAWA